MNELLDQLAAYAPLTNADRRLVEQIMQPLRLPKGALFVEAGKRTDRIGFVTEGLFRVFSVNEQGDELTRYFMAEGQFVVSLDPFNTGKVAERNIEALENSRLLVISKTDVQGLSSQISNWDKIVNAAIERGLLEKMYDRTELIHLDAKSRYLDFLERFDHLSNRIPLKFLASYLGMKQPSLSRIRRELAQI
ncbi:MAG: Crp/Fnr family transcriptional regulator [Bacteroidota bacterium]